MSNLRTAILKRRSLKISALILCAILLMSGCAETEKTDNTSQQSGLNEQIVEMVLENTEMGDSIDASDIVQDSDFLPESYLIGFNGEFFNSNADIMNNMLLTSEYNTPDEIDLFQL